MNVWTVAQAAEFLKVTPKTVAQWCASGFIPATKLGRAWRLDEKAVRDWLTARCEQNVRWQLPPQDGTLQTMHGVHWR